MLPDNEKPPMSALPSFTIIGHITQDITPQGSTIGGTVAYSGLTAAALGHPVQILTCADNDVDLSALKNTKIQRIPGTTITQFENIQTAQGRKQILHQRAASIELGDWPPTWEKKGILQLAPVAQEVDIEFVDFLQGSFVCATPQGWMRSWNTKGEVSHCKWQDAAKILPKLQATVISLEDVNGDESQIEEMAKLARVLAVTEAQNGSRVYWNGDVRNFKAPQVAIVDGIGAGDVYAAVFFSRLYTTRDPWHAGQAATQIASLSVRKTGLESIPTEAEIRGIMVEIIKAH